MEHLHFDIGRLAGSATLSAEGLVARQRRLLGDVHRTTTPNAETFHLETPVSHGNTVEVTVPMQVYSVVPLQVFHVVPTQAYRVVRIQANSERLERIELSSPLWKSGVLPLHNRRKLGPLKGFEPSILQSGIEPVSMPGKATKPQRTPTPQSCQTRNRT
jgi:hypothetical protein